MNHAKGRVVEVTRKVVFGCDEEIEARLASFQLAKQLTLVLSSVKT